MSEHGNDADDDAIALTVLPGILAVLACWSWPLTADSSVGRTGLDQACGGRASLGMPVGKARDPGDEQPATVGSETIARQPDSIPVIPAHGRRLSIRPSAAGVTGILYPRRTRAGGLPCGLTASYELPAGAAEGGGLHGLAVPHQPG
jgi:hypothetical protein